jgi:outer membrane protein assembly factor BamB
MAGCGAAAAAPLLARSGLAAMRGRWVGLATLRTVTGAELSSPFEVVIKERAAPPEKGGGIRWFGHFSLPERFVFDAPLAPAEFDGERLRFGPFEFRYESATDSLVGELPVDLVPFYDVHVVLHRTLVEPVRPARPEIAAPTATPLWTRTFGAPLWADLGGSGDTLVCALDDGRVIALEARGGATRWTLATKAMIRARPVLADGAVFVQADDGFLYRIDARSGKTVWRVRVNDQPIKRLPPLDPKSRFDFRGGAVLLDGDAQRGTLYLGTHEGRVLALAARNGATRWSYKTGGPVLAAPSLARDRLFVGSFDHRVHAINAADGAPIWQHDTGAAVSSTPTVAGDRVIIGSRSYELRALAIEDGRVLWASYLWYSWIESSAAVDGGIAYVGSSDAAQLGAYDVANGRAQWATDVQAPAWGTPALTTNRVYIGTRVAPSLMPHRHAHALALDRATGEVRWRYPVAAPPGKPRGASWGINSSPILLGRRVFFGTLEGAVLCFDATA